MVFSLAAFSGQSRNHQRLPGDSSSFFQAFSTIRLGSCCGCLSLQKGTILIGVMCLSSMLMSVVMLGMGVHELEKHEKGYDIIISIKLAANSALMFAIASAIVAGLLIVGAIKEKHHLMFPAVAIGYTSIIFEFGVCFAAIVILFPMIVSDEPAATVATHITMMWILLITAAMHFYMWLVVNTYYRQLVAESFISPPVAQFVYVPEDGKQLPIDDNGKVVSPYVPREDLKTSGPPPNEFNAA